MENIRENKNGVEKLNILCLNNNFYGSYESSQIFHVELAAAFRNIGAKVFEAADWQSAENICKVAPLNFSVSFGKYFYATDDFFYNKYKIPHYQWVSDNPLKMNLDTTSGLITYIFIDEEYVKMLSSLANECLILPLGFLEKNFQPFDKKRRGILFPCKIRNLKSVWRDIQESSVAKLVKDFLFDYELDDSYISSLSRFFEQKEIICPATRILIFRLSNEFLRVKKRLTILNSLSDYSIYVAGEDYQNVLRRPSNVTFLPPIKYANLVEVMKSFRFVVNVDPNYHACIHDRFVRAVGAGCVCLTNQNFVMQRWNANTYTFDDKSDINDLIQKVSGDVEGNFFRQLNCIKKFSWEESAKKIVAQYLRGVGVRRYEL